MKQTARNEKLGLVILVRMEKYLKISGYDFRTVALSLCYLFGFLSVLLVGGETAKGETIAKEDFELGSLSGWALLPTPNGTLGGEGYPSFVPCDMEGREKLSQCLRVKVGQIQYESGHDLQQGGMLEIRQETGTGLLRLSARVMVAYRSPTDKRNLAGGLFEWLIDEKVVAAHDVGPIENETILRFHLRAAQGVRAGLHVIQLRISRPFKSGGGQQAPIQFVDDLAVDFSPKP